ncbi:PEP-utilizing enzyme [Paenibacillus sabuli]|uniref:PEP-utilizing enzyme n=1 Tax=Paenibacillus sabuli TaxID=2772509 RepID=UPI001CC33171|nr:PEP-utilizing enzyme [Paenibacillus sabuli]
MLLPLPVPSRARASSHCAIIARSIGIPAVVGIGSGLLDIRDGQRLRLDGSSGTVAALRA